MEGSLTEHGARVVGQVSRPRAQRIGPHEVVAP